MQVTIPHQFKTKEAAVARVRQALTEARGQIAGQATIEREEWVGSVLHFAFVAQGHHISGTLGVGDQEFDLQAKLPLVFKLFEGKLERMIKEQVAGMIAQK